MTQNWLQIYGKSVSKDNETMVDLVNYGINWSGPWPSARSGTNLNDIVNIRQHDIMLTEVQKQEYR